MPEASFVSIRTPEAPPSTATRRREDSMCAAVLEHADGVVVPAASLDARFRHNPFVTGPLGDVRSYASAPLTTPDGVIIGRLCVFDSTPPAISTQPRRRRWPLSPNAWWTSWSCGCAPADCRTRWRP